MAGLQDLLEAYRNYRGTQEWKLGKQEEQMLGGDPQAMGLWEKLQGFGPADMGGIAGAIKTYHGSPRAEPFTHFNKEFINTGEGAQAFGHGHYLAERPGIAKSYAEMRGPMFEEQRLMYPHAYDSMEHHVAHNATFTKPSNPQQGLPGLLKKYIRELETRQKWLDKALKHPNAGGNPNNIPNWSGQIQEYNDKITALNRLMADKDLSDQIFNDVLSKYPINGSPLRSLYEVSLEWPGARESTDPMSYKHFYQWDEKFSDQPEHVKEALLDIHRSNPEIFPNIGTKAIREHLKGWTDVPRGILEPLLYERGVPGVSYLDAMSRGDVSNPSRNYVAFGDEIPRIVSHNKPSVLKMLWPKKER